MRCGDPLMRPYAIEFHHRPNLERQSNRNSSDTAASAIVKSPFDQVSLSVDSSGETTVINRYRSRISKQAHQMKG